MMSLTRRSLQPASIMLAMTSKIGTEMSDMDSMRSSASKTCASITCLLSRHVLVIQTVSLRYEDHVLEIPTDHK